MILRDKILAQLEGKAKEFHQFEGELQDESEEFRSALDRLAAMSSAELEAVLESKETPGALPTEEFDAAPKLRFPFPHTWNNHAEARAWAYDALLNHTTLAVDGSQIPPHSGFNIPVAAVQVAWFENHHSPEGWFVKDIEMEVLTPEDLKAGSDGERTEQKINARRFEMETGKLCERLERLASERRPQSPLPVALFDSSLVISFADRLQGNMRERHINAMLKLLQCSETTGIPLIGYVDSSDARDLTKMLSQAFGLSEARQLHDAELVDAQLSWGDRTPLFICKRGSADQKQASVMELFESQQQSIGFVYLKTGSQSPPARLEIPMWIHRHGLLDQVLDVVRAEVVVGNGYPYAIETADAAAVISTRDREAFYALFQQFAERQNIKLHVSQKAASKARRRYS
ncbi:MAG TPA: DNA double-strand break repair nuclease NurA [Blastocatellia bacterium]|nr:DNA double-strand break repair nuclease NurA [Blastocatellia bacterium]